MEASFAQGAPPITLIDGDKLVDPLIEYGIGIRKRAIEILTIDLDSYRTLRIRKTSERTRTSHCHDGSSERALGGLVVMSTTDPSCIL